MDDMKLRRIERELEQTRNALHWQTKRCNHLVAALTLKLEQRDADVLATRHERETQLAQIMRALLVLEARLRREQRSIRAQLGSRDALIREQQLEIERLKKMIEPQRPVSPPESFRNDPVEEFDGSVKPDLISSLGIWQQTNNKTLKTAQTSNGEQQLEERQPANPSKNLVASKSPEHHLEESLGIWPNKPFKTPHTSKGEQTLQERPNNPSTNLEPSKTKSPNLEEFTTRRTKETLKMPEHHLQEFRSRRTEEESIAEEHHLEELTNHDYREPLVSNGGSNNPGNPLTTDVTNTTKFGHEEPLVTNAGSSYLGNPVTTDASNTTKYVPINDSSGDVGSSKFRPKTLSVNECSTEDVGTKGVGTNKYRQKGLLINGDLEDLTTKYRQKSLKVNGGGENVSSNNVKYMQKGLVLDGVVNDVTTTSYRPKKFELEDVPKVTSPRQRKMLMNGGVGTETSLERTPSSSSSSSTLSSTLSSLSSASSVSLMSSSSSILKPSSFDDEEDDGLVGSSGGAAVERGKKEEKTVKISDIIQVRTHSDDLSECESSDSFTIIHDMKKAAEYRNGDVDAEVNNLKTLPSALLHEMQVQSKTGRNEYHDNPVLECVNQILLRDQEEFLEEQRVLRMRENEKSQSQENLNLVGRSSSRDDLTRLEQDKNLVVSRRMLQTTYNDKPPCLVTSSQLSLIGSVNFDEELNAVDVSSREQKSKQMKSVGKRSLIPPALPPKPLKLLSMRSPDFEASQQNLKSKQHSPQSKLPQKYDLDIRLLDNQPQPSCHPIIIGNASPALPEPNPDSELYVISNSALDDDLVQQIQGRNKKCGKELKNVLHPEQKGMNLTHALIHFPAGKNSGGKEVVGVSPSKFEDKRKTTPVKNMPVIKVASPVSTLLATSSVEGKGVEEEVVPSVSQMVKRFEHLSEEKVEGDGNTALSDNFDDGNSALRDNFEEFRLDDMDVICGVTAEEDNENKEPEKCLNGSVDTTTASVTVTPSEAGVSYENFLEATGLSQKSIMTPSRIFSNNHRNVLKPKDVKHRSRVKAANTISNPTVRYWTEPFL